MSLTTEDRVLAGRYRLDGKLGEGGSAEVHRGWDVLLRRFVAVKLFEPGADSVGWSRFDEEVRTLAALSHPALVSVYDAGTCGGTSFVVLQLVAGQTLRDRLEEGPLPVEQVRALGARLADALAHVHEQGVVHREVKPSNVLLDRSGTAYLADFGLGPEQVRGEDGGPGADVRALGLVLLECLTGRTADRDDAAVTRPDRPPVIPRDVPADLARLVRSMTSPSARRRPTAAACAEALRKRFQSAVAPTAAEPDIEFTRPLSRVKLLIASAVVASFVGTAWAVSDTIEPVSSAPQITQQHAPPP